MTVCRYLFALLAVTAISAAQVDPVPEPQFPGEPPLVDVPPAGPVPAPGFQQGDPRFSPEPPTPVVAISVRVAASASAGQELVYRISVVNRSQADAHHVTVRNPQPANSDFVRADPEPATRDPEIVWRLGTLRAGQSREINLVVRPTGSGEVSSCARVAFEHGQCVTTRIARPALTIRKTAPTQVSLYDAVSFRIEVVNTGATPLTDVVVTDILPREFRLLDSRPEPDRRALLTWTFGTLRPGEQRSIDYQASALQEGTFSNRAVVTAGELRQESVARVTVGKAKLTLALTGPERSYANQPADYELTVTNSGSSAVNNLLVAVALPATARLVNASDAGQQVEGEVRWSLPTLAAGAKKALRLQVGATAAGEITLKATARADRDVAAQAELKTDFKGVAGLTAQLNKVDPLAVNQEGRYELTVRNTGTDSANDVKVVATLPAQLQATDAQGPGKSTLEADRVTFEPAVIKAGEQVRYLVYVKALKPGDVRFRVEITARELTAGPLRKEASTTIFEE